MSAQVPDDAGEGDFVSDPDRVVVKLGLAEAGGGAPGRDRRAGRDDAVVVVWNGKFVKSG